MLKKYLPVGIAATGGPVVRLVPGTGSAGPGPGAGWLPTGRVYADELTLRVQARNQEMDQIVV